MNEELIDVSAGDLIPEEFVNDVSSGDPSYTDIIEDGALVDYINDVVSCEIELLAAEFSNYPEALLYTTSDGKVNVTSVQLSENLVRIYIKGNGVSFYGGSLYPGYYNFEKYYLFQQNGGKFYCDFTLPDDCVDYRFLLSIGSSPSYSDFQKNGRLFTFHFERNKNDSVEFPDLEAVTASVSEMSADVKDLNTSLIALVSVTSCIFLVVLVAYAMKSVKRIMKGFGGRYDI